MSHPLLVHHRKQPLDVARSRFAKDGPTAMPDAMRHSSPEPCWVSTFNTRLWCASDTSVSARRTETSTPFAPRTRPEIWGLCLPDSCSEGLGRGTALYADLFASQAPLTDEQMLAEQAMLAMTTKEFWEQAAWDNGITDMAAVGEMRQRVANDLNAEFLAAGFQISTADRVLFGRLSPCSNSSSPVSFSAWKSPL